LSEAETTNPPLASIKIRFELDDFSVLWLRHVCIVREKVQVCGQFESGGVPTMQNRQYCRGVHSHREAKVDPKAGQSSRVNLFFVQWVP
jgi:hypothetical protein